MTKTEKQVRLDNFEIRNIWPELAAARFWAYGEIVAVRRASSALYNADVNRCCVGSDEMEAANRRVERAERMAKKAAAGLLAALSDSFLSRGVCISPDFVRIGENGAGFRFIELRGRVRGRDGSYNFID